MNNGISAAGWFGEFVFNSSNYVITFSSVTTVNSSYSPSSSTYSLGQNSFTYTQLFNGSTQCSIKNANYVYQNSSSLLNMTSNFTFLLSLTNISSNFSITQVNSSVNISLASIQPYFSISNLVMSPQVTGAGNISELSPLLSNFF